MRFNSLSFIVLFLFCAQVSKAGSPDSTDHTPFIAGTKALQFRIGSNFSLNPFQGSLISYQKQLTAERARRIGIKISSNLSNSHGSTTKEAYNPLDSTFNTEDFSYARNDNRVSLSITMQKIKYSSLKTGFYSYRGIGPILGLGYNLTNINPNTDRGSWMKNITKTMSIGFSFVMGVEWFIKSNMSLLAEYRPSVSVGYKYKRNYLKSVDSFGSYIILDDVTKGPTFQISSGVKFGLSIYLE